MYAACDIAEIIADVQERRTQSNEVSCGFLGLIIAGQKALAKGCRRVGIGDPVLPGLFLFLSSKSRRLKEYWSGGFRW